LYKFPDGPGGSVPLGPSILLPHSGEILNGCVVFDRFDRPRAVAILRQGTPSLFGPPATWMPLPLVMEVPMDCLLL
jgi:hypothetical protein